MDREESGAASDAAPHPHFTKNAIPLDTMPLDPLLVSGVDPALEARLESVRTAEAKRKSLTERIRKERRVLLPVLGLCLLALPNFRMAKVQGHSMEPRYTTGDSLVLLKTFRLFTPVKVGDIVIVHLKHGKNKGEEIVKRVIYVQNEKGNAPWPEFIHNSRTEVSGPIRADSWFPEYTSGSETVPVGSVMVMGDNTFNSMDSRDFGPIADYEIEGKVLNP